MLYLPTTPEAQYSKSLGKQRCLTRLAEGVGFEPTDGLPHLLISSQVPLTTQPSFQPFIRNDLRRQWKPQLAISYGNLAAAAETLDYPASVTRRVEIAAEPAVSGHQPLRSI